MKQPFESFRYIHSVTIDPATGSSTAEAAEAAHDLSRLLGVNVNFVHNGRKFKAVLKTELVHEMVTGAMPMLEKSA